MNAPSSYLQTLHPLQPSSHKLPSPTLSSKKNPIHTLIIPHLCRILRALTKAKSVLLATFKATKQPIHFIYPTKKNKRTNKIFFGSFRLHYNWCSSSHVMPVPSPGLDYTYYDPSWNSIILTDGQQQEQQEEASEAQLSGYLQWLEEKKEHDNSSSTEEKDVNEIDKLAEIFIANCHEKFILEKQESYRRFQEMLARSM